MTDQAKPEYYFARWTIFSPSFMMDIQYMLVYLINESRRELQRMIILGHLYRFPPLHCLRGVICEEIEMRLAGRAESHSWFTRIVKSHRQPAAWRCPPANLRHTDLSSRRSPSSSRAFMAAITQRLWNESQSQPAVDSVGCCEKKNASKWFAVQQWVFQWLFSKRQIRENGSEVSTDGPLFFFF